jgi:hypothetical protein
MSIKLLLDSIDDISKDINTNLHNFNTNFNNFNTNLNTDLNNFSKDFMINLKKIDDDIKTTFKINKT